MVIGVLKEPYPEARVSLLPETVAALVKIGHQVLVETNAGLSAYAPDEQYLQAGASIESRTSVCKADVLLGIQAPQDILSGNFSGKILLGVYQPLFQRERMEDWAKAGVTLFSLDMLPRITRAQSMDVLSSQANIAGYKAVLLASVHYPRYFPMLMTAAGTVAPARVLVLGAGVAGLQAVATARRLGAVVEVFDTRPAVREEVKSLGAKFIEVEGAADASNAAGYAVEQDEAFKQRQHRKIAESIAKSDIVITTAQIPGKAAPILVTTEMLDTMRPGSLIIDLAAGTGGNTSLTRDQETIRYKEIRIMGESNLAASLPSDASKMYGKNIQQFLTLLTGKEAALEIKWEDELVKGTCITHEHRVVHERLTQNK